MSGDRLRYVVLHHTDVAQPHFDLLFEASPGSPLRSFRLPTWPINGSVVAEPLADHRAIYLTYEGEISGGRGHVRRVATGDAAIAFHTDRIELNCVAYRILLQVADSTWVASSDAM